MLVPISVNSSIVKLNKNNNYLENIKSKFQEEPCIYITNLERTELMLYIENNYEKEEQTKAYTILDNITFFNDEYQIYEINMTILSDSINENTFYNIIPQEEIDNTQSKSELDDLIYQFWTFQDYKYAGLINAILEIIKGRLGWIYDLFNMSANLFIEGVNLLKQFIQNIQNLEIAKLVVTFVNVLVSIPAVYFTDAINKLFNLNLDGFINTISNFTNVFTTKLRDMVTLTESVLEQLSDYFEPLLLYVNQVGYFIDWVNSEPWKNQITIKGNAVNLLLLPYTNAEVTCRNGSDIIDENGQFSFTVTPTNNSEESIPSNSYYGLHLCVITVTKNDEIVKQTPEVLSYVFSGGTIEWFFIVPKIKPKNIEIENNILYKFDLLFQKFQIFTNYLT